VNELYPSDCIRFSSVLSPSYGRFRVEGTPVAIEKESSEPKASEPTLTNSLPLKQSKRAQEQGQESTPHSDEDKIPNAPASTVPPSELEQDIACGVEIRERDALDDVIDDTKAISHLVGAEVYQAQD